MLLPHLVPYHIVPGTILRYCRTLRYIHHHYAGTVVYTITMLVLWCVPLDTHQLCSASSTASRVHNAACQHRLPGRPAWPCVVEPSRPRLQNAAPPPPTRLRPGEGYDPAEDPTTLWPLPPSSGAHITEQPARGDGVTGRGPPHLVHATAADRLPSPPSASHTPSYLSLSCPRPTAAAVAARSHAVHRGTQPTWPYLPTKIVST